MPWVYQCSLPVSHPFHIPRGGGTVRFCADDKNRAKTGRHGACMRIICVRLQVDMLSIVTLPRILVLDKKVHKV